MSEVDRQRAGFTFIWKIENFSLFPKLSKQNVIRSPVFIADNLNESCWCLELHPTGFSLENKDAFIFCLFNIYEIGALAITLDYELSILSNGPGPYLLTTPREIFCKREILPGDTLTVQCKMWHHEEQCLKSGFGLARTRISAERKSFIWTIENFSSLQVNDMKSVSLKLTSNSKFTITLYLIGMPTYDEEIRIKIKGNNEEPLAYMIMLGISVLNVNGEVVYHSKDDLRLCKGEKEQPFPLILEKKQLSSNKDLLLPNDVLSLRCVLVVSKLNLQDSIVLNEIEHTSYGSDAASDLEAVINATETLDLKKDENSSSNSLTNDLKHLFEDKYLADINFRVHNEVIPAHKAILAARSSVFKAMFDADMKEKFSNTIKIEDFKPDTIRRMLLYIYSDTLDSDILWENASNLYFAAEKYALVGLKQKCSSFLKVHLNLTNVCETLILADILSDEDLKNSAFNFVEKNDKDVMNSTEWKEFVQKNPQLSVEILSRLYKNVKKF
ncbi:TD and POZ domain-containing protein 1-like [Argiope bruennichi]|uniref:TD and POZ domain-containing protein 1-like n=1 Tax=Argiope bruennichi TaxID=94029 RepID=A0A8T0EGK8_ARGBR|nr:TD and POZ domain-containing protein 1-like [Argiope bruennichi]